MKRIPALLVALMFLQPVFPHYKARYHVIIDTDGGVDDFRAICLMLASPEIEVIAITTVDGVLTPGITAEKVGVLLNRFGHEGIPVGTGTEVLPLVLKSIALEDMPVDFVALGPLSNLGAVLHKSPEIASLIRRLYWYNRDGATEDFNHAVDPQAASDVLQSAISIDFVSAEGFIPGSPVQLIPALDTIPSRYAPALRDFFTGAPGDDCIPLYLLYPDNFYVSAAGTGDSPAGPERNEAILKSDADPVSMVMDILENDREDKSIIFSSFPADPLFFREDVSIIAGEIIKKHGLKEWKIVVLTNEFHEHLGIYSILGAKMGLRAREYFNVGIDELGIVSYAGTTPPVSCLNDGLQVSTGATLGHGTIRLAEDNSFPVKGQFIPMARFTFKNQVIEISIKKEIRDKIHEDVSQGVKSFGLESPEYWAYIRKLALRYWLELNRMDIFEIE